MAPLTKRYLKYLHLDDKNNKIYSVQNKIAIHLKYFKLGDYSKFQEKIILILPIQIFVNKLRIS
jgi:hypothetical protein